MRTRWHILLRRISDHSARKTTVSKLIRDELRPWSVLTQTAHRNCPCTALHVVRRPARLKRRLGTPVLAAATASATVRTGTPLTASTRSPGLRNPRRAAGAVPRISNTTTPLSGRPAPTSCAKAGDRLPMVTPLSRFSPVMRVSDRAGSSGAGRPRRGCRRPAWRCGSEAGRGRRPPCRRLPSGCRRPRCPPLPRVSPACPQ